MTRDYPLEEILLPMGGTTVKDLDKMDEIWESGEYVAEEKFDGSRYLSVGGRFFSRRVSVVDNLPVEKTDNVPHLKFLLEKFPLLLLDGEVYINGGNSNKVVSIMGAKPDKAIARQEESGYVDYVVYDILRDSEGNWLIDLPWHERRAKLESELEKVFDSDPIAENYISISEYEKENKKEFCSKVMLRGGEGVMLKNINGTYHPDKKPRWNWIKVKQEITSDVIITGFKPAVREYKPTREELTESWQYWEKRDHDFDGEIVEVKGNPVSHKAANYEGDDVTYMTPATKLYGIDKDGLVRFVRVYGDRPNGLVDSPTFGISVVTDIEFEPVTKFYFYDWIGAVEFSQYSSDGELKQVGYCSGLTEELRKDMSENKDKYLNECMEISAMERTKDGYFRHPQFLRMRPDKNQKDCVIGVD